jgi:hypothetical protein
MYALPVDELTKAEMKTFRRQARMSGEAEALRLALGASNKELVSRNILPATDMGAPAGSGFTNEAFITGAVAANTWTSIYDTGAVAQLGTRKVLVIYAIAHMGVPTITAVRFRLGATGTSMLGWLHLETLLEVKLTQEVYLSEPIVYTRDQWMDIQVYSRIAIPAAGERIGLRGFVIEPVGETLS